MFFNFSCPEQTEYQAEKFTEYLKFCQQKELLGYWAQLTILFLPFVHSQRATN